MIFLYSVTLGWPRRADHPREVIQARQTGLTTCSSLCPSDHQEPWGRNVSSHQHPHLALCSSSCGTQACHVQSIGEGPVIFIHPTQIDFGNIYVLKDTSRILQLSNQSFIPAEFRARLVSKSRATTALASVQGSYFLHVFENELPEQLLAKQLRTMSLPTLFLFIMVLLSTKKHNIHIW